MAVREPLVLLPAPRALRFRPPLSSLLPIADAVALGSVCSFIGLGPISLIGFRPIGIVFAVLTFLILNSDSSRVFRINPRLGDDAEVVLAFDEALDDVAVDTDAEEHDAHRIKLLSRASRNHIAIANSSDSCDAPVKRIEIIH